MSTPLATPLTAQKIRAVLRKAGERPSKAHRSGMVRGWITWSPGFRVQESAMDKSVIRIWYKHDNEDARKRGLDRCVEALKDYSPERAKDMDFLVIYPKA